MAPIAGPDIGATAASSEAAAGIGGVLLVFVLIVLLAYLELFNVSEYENDRLESLLVAGAIPLGVTFVAIIVWVVQSTL